MTTHEDLTRDEHPAASGEREFGMVFAGVFALIGGIKLWHESTRGWWWLAGAAISLVLALAAPSVLRPLNLLWFKLSILLYRIVNPVMMGLMFFIVITPFAILMRLTKKDPLQIKADPSAKSYWIIREPPGPTPETMKNQF